MIKQNTSKIIATNLNKPPFHFSTIGQDIWFQVEHIRNLGIKASKIENKQQNDTNSWKQHPFRFNKFSNTALDTEIKSFNSINITRSEKIELINLEHKPLMQVAAKLSNQQMIVTIDNGAQRTLMHPEKFNQIKKQLKIIKLPKDSSLQSVNGAAIQEEGRYLIKNAISFTRNQIPEDLSVIVCPETPFPILLGLPQLRKWDTQIMHSQNLSKEVLIVNGFTNESPKLKTKLHATIIPKQQKEDNYISLCLQKDIKVMPSSGKTIQLNHNCPVAVSYTHLTLPTILLV